MDILRLRIEIEKDFLILRPKYVREKVNVCRCENDVRVGKWVRMRKIFSILIFLISRIP